MIQDNGVLNEKVEAILFIFLLGGFAAILNEGGGFQAIVRLFLRTGGDASKRLQGIAAGLGIICFFDGLANSMMVGRICKDMTEKCGVSRVKLAYIADSTSSAVACRTGSAAVSFTHTWHPIPGLSADRPTSISESST